MSGLYSVNIKDIQINCLETIELLQDALWGNAW